MDWITSLNEAVKYLESHMADEISYDKAAIEGCAIKAFPPISFSIMVKGDTMMEYRIEKKEEFRIVGVSVPLEKDIEKNFSTVPAAWQKAWKNSWFRLRPGQYFMEVVPIFRCRICSAGS